MTDTADFTENAPVYSLFLVFAEPELIETRASADEAVRLTEQLSNVFTELAESHVEVRGTYDLTGFDSEASVLIWLRSTTIDDLQWAKRQLQRTLLLGDTVIVESIVTLSVSELEGEAKTWLSLAPVSAEQVGDDFEDFDEDFDAEYDEDHYREDELDAEELAAADRETAQQTEGPTDDAAGQEIASEEFEAEDPYEDFEVELTGIHTQIGIGQLRLLATVEADNPSLLIGRSVTMLENGLVTVANPTTGRNVTTAELYEILR
ncbi:MAG: chlorite dismutase family protein [Gulosibacter sp.]|uniref:chlorite dismutase family protein n=1 Tax=Gulosibacter sp. TaxID=2817531 RepID=UPI003F8E96A7